MKEHLAIEYLKIYTTENISIQSIPSQIEIL